MVSILMILFLILNSFLVEYTKSNPILPEEQHVNQSKTIDLKTFKKVSDDFDECMSKSADNIGKQLRIENKLHDEFRNFRYLEFFKKVCNKTSDFLNCHNIYTIAFDRFDEKHEEELAQTEQYLKDTLDYICYNNTERVELFAINNGLMCLLNDKTINDCGLAGGFELIAYGKAAINPTLLLAASKSDQNRFCKSAENYWNCVVEQMETCDSKIPAKIIKELVNYLVKHSICEQFYQPTTIN